MNDEFDPRHDTPVIVTIRDRKTGATHTTPGWSTWWWTEGNGSCDCNRWPPTGSGVICRGGPCVSERFEIVAVVPLLDGYTLADFNQGY